MRNELGFMMSAIMAVILLTAAPVMGQTPNTISYQGRLTNAAGQPITATTSVVFTIYTLASGGSALDTWTINVTPDANGIFTVELGPVSVGTFDGSKRYLGIKAGADSEMTPRQLLTSAPYAFNTNNIADNAITSAKIVDGTIGTADIGAGGVGNADLAANAVDAAKVADGSLTKADILDEAGFSFIQAGDANTLLAITGTGTAFTSVTLNAPAAGYALVIGSFKLFVKHINGSQDNLIFKISTTSGDVNTPSFNTALVRVPSEWPSTASYFCTPVYLSYVFPVTAGANNFYLNGYESTTTGDDRYHSGTITAIFLPSVFGTAPVVPSSSVANENPGLVPNTSTGE